MSSKKEKETTVPAEALDAQVSAENAGVETPNEGADTTELQEKSDLGADTTELQKKSDLIKEQIELEKQYEDGTVTMLEETYSVKIGSKGNFDRLVKMVEHDFEFNYNTATGLALLYSNLKQQKPFTREEEWNGNIFLKTSSCLMMWQFITTYKGTGFFDARAFLEMIQFVGPELSKHVRTINDKQKALRGLHLRLDEIDNLLDEGKYENDLTEEEEKKLVEELKNVIKKEREIEDEVNPEVQI